MRATIWLRRFSMVIFALTLVSALGFAQERGALWKEGQALQQDASRITRDATRLGTTGQPLEVLSRHLGVPVDRLRDQKQTMKLTYGELAVGHEIAKASGRNFGDIARQLKERENWGMIISETGVNVGSIRSSLDTTDMALKQAYQEMHRGYHR